jgi:S-adenosylmethionine hydrolase
MGPLSSTIALLTDFGDRDEYAGVLRGAILRRAPQAVIVDLCHQVAPHDIRQAAAMIAAAYRYFPEQTLHVMVVDPGVGGKRDIVFARTQTFGFLCPDNGLLSELIVQGHLISVRRVTNRALFAEVVSTTFHGRDIIAPVAGYLASGGPPENLGPRQAIHNLVCLDMSPAGPPKGGIIEGVVRSVDGFGNLVTNIDRALLTSILEDDLEINLVVDTGGRWTLPLASSYDARPVGALLATIGSRDTLEIAVNQGHAGRQIGVAPGTIIRISGKNG